ncbi:MAG: phage holin family protein [Gammaproteobacteria bacterium]
MGTARVRAPGTLDRLAALSSSVMRMLYTRVELAGLELALERDSLLERAEITLIGVVSAGLAGFSAILMAALAVPEQYRVAALAGLTVLFSIIAVSAYLRVRKHTKERVPLFARLTRQLRRDRAVLESARSQSAQSETARIRPGRPDASR